MPFSNLYRSQPTPISHPASPPPPKTMGGLAILQTLATLCAVTLNVCPIFDEIPGTCLC